MSRSYVLIIFTPIYLFALTPELKTDYSNFKKKYSQLLMQSSDQKSFLSSFTKNYKNLKNDFESFSQKEKKEISKEGNQMALDLEMLEPLELLATTTINKESCEEAHLLNEMNSTSDVNTFEKVKESLKQLCKNKN